MRHSAVKKRRINSRGSSVAADGEESTMSWDGTADADNDYSCEGLREDERSAEGKMPELEELERICIAFERGVKRKHRKYHLRRRGHCSFRGSHAVDFLVENGHATTREQALQIGRQLAYNFALFHHTTNDFDLEDKKNLLYEFTPLDQRVTSTSSEAEKSLSFQPRLSAIAEAFEEGVLVGTNVYKNKSFRKTFVGSDAVTFLVASGMARTRPDAVRIGQLLEETYGMFGNVAKKHKFKDRHLLYRFVPKKERTKDCCISYRGSIPIEETAQLFREVVKPGNAFSGSSAVDAMIHAGLVASRSEAVLLGQKLSSDLQMFHHCARDGEGAFFDRPDVYYEYCRGHEWVPSRKFLDNDDSSRHTYATVDGAEYQLLDEFDLAMVMIDSKKEQSTINEKTNNDIEEFKSKTNCDACGITFPVGDDMLDFKNMFYFGEKAEGRPLNDGGKLPNESAELTQSSQICQRYFDRFGFILENEDDICDASVYSSLCSYICDNNSVKTTEKELSDDEWKVLLDSCALTNSGKSPTASYNKVKRFMRLGLPDSLRSRAWTVITGVDAMLQEREGEYETLCETAVRLMAEDSEHNVLQGVIERDLHRTFPSHVLFCNSNHGDNDRRAQGESFPLDGSTVPDVDSAEKFVPDGLVSLRRVLYSYSIYDKEVGYCQGMNFIAAMFLTFLSEEESFWLLVAIMNEEPYGMRDLFAEDMAGVHETLYVTDKLIQRFLPKLHAHLEEENVNISMYATEWVMTVFTRTFDFDLVSRVWDSYIVEGWKVVYRVILSLLEQAQQSLLLLDMEDILTYLRDDFPSEVDGISVMRKSLKIPLRQRHIRKYTTEWRTKQDGRKQFTRQLSIYSESVASFETASSLRPFKQMIIGQCVGTRLLPGLSRRSSL